MTTFENPPNDGFESFNPDPPVAPPEVTPPSKPPAAFSIDDLVPDEPPAEDETERLRRENEELRSRPPQHFEQAPPTPAFAPPAAPATPAEEARNKLRAEVMKRLTSNDPNAVADAFLFAAELGAGASRQYTDQRVGPLQGGVLQSTVDKFKSDVEASNPTLYKAVKKDFEALVAEGEARLRANPQNAENMTTTQVNEACTTFFEQAKGRALDRLIAKGKAPAAPAVAAPAAPANAPAAAQTFSPPEIPPNYSGAAGRATPASTTLTPKTEEDRLTIQMGREAGLSDADISALL